MKYESLIAVRHLKSRRSRSLSVVSWLAIGGVALGVTALVCGFSVTTGFEKAFQEKVMSVTAHVMVRQYGIQFRNYEPVQAQIAQVPGVVASSPMTFNEAMFSAGAGTAGAIVKGVKPADAARVLSISQQMESGRFEDLSKPATDGAEGILLGVELARSIGVQTGSLVTVISPRLSSSDQRWAAQAGTPTSKSFRVRGVFRAGFHEYDARLAYMDMAVAQRFFGTDGSIMALEVRVEDPMGAGEAANRIDTALGAGGYSVLDWRRQNRNLFASLTYQRLAILLVLSVMVVLAACNVACLLIMLVIERTRDIAILKTMGARRRSILKIFVLEGMGIGVIGTVFGVIAAYCLCEGLLSNGIALDPKVYGISRLPVVFDPRDYVMASIGAGIITFFASIVPAMRGASLRPTDGLRDAH
ncbi:MAG: ABC transporter permease [Myxococcota bacterium]|nr:ABC transporter permease [Myxococcota bacterium]